MRVSAFTYALHTASIFLFHSSSVASHGVGICLNNILINLYQYYLTTEFPPKKVRTIHIVTVHILGTVRISSCSSSFTVLSDLRGIYAEGRI
jgi:hypothetical protein